MDLCGAVFLLRVWRRSGNNHDDGGRAELPLPQTLQHAAGWRIPSAKRVALKYFFSEINSDVVL